MQNIPLYLNKGNESLVTNSTIIINKNLSPWNVYGHINYPDLKTPLNVIAGNKEYYNSYMPPFFDFDGISLITELKNLIDSGVEFTNIIENETCGKKYLKYLKNILADENISKTVEKLNKRVSDYFNVVEKGLITIEPQKKTYAHKTETLSYIYIALNMMQLFMDPVEAFIVGKHVYNLDFKNNIFEYGRKSTELLEKCVPLDIAFLPLAFLFNTNENVLVEDKVVKTVFDYMRNALFCTQKELTIGLKYADSKYNCSEYLTDVDVRKILNTVYERILNLNGCGEDVLMINMLQLLNSCMTWSKYIPLQLEPLRFRYYTTNQILLNIKQQEWVNDMPYINISDLDTVSISGAEKQGKLFFLLESIFTYDQDLKDKVIQKANLLLAGLVK